MENIANNIRTLREKRKMSLEGVARRIGVSKSAVQKWEAGKTYPHILSIIEMCELFGVSLEEIVFGEEK